MAFTSFVAVTNLPMAFFFYHFRIAFHGSGSWTYEGHDGLRSILFFFALIWLTTTILLADRWKKTALKLLKNLALPNSIPKRVNTLIIRGSADEASLALALAKLIDWFLSRVWRISSNTFEILDRLVKLLPKVWGKYESSTPYAVLVFICISSVFLIKVNE